MSNALHLSFFEATRDVFELMLDLEKISETSGGIQQATDACGNLTIAIGVTGDLSGDILYVFPKDTMLQMVKIMSGGMEVNEVDDFVTSAIGEISNIISGKALIALSEKNVACDILPPRVIQSNDGTCAMPLDSSTQICTEIGSVGLEIHLQAN